MAEWGADVIKIEPPNGDLWRNQQLTLPPTDDFNLIYQARNQSKKHLCLDLKQVKEKEVFFKILEDADVLVTSFRNKALQKLGLTYEELSIRFPKLVYVQATGYGEKGPDCDRPGFDTISFWARTGLMVDVGQKGESPLSAPGTLR